MLPLAGRQPLNGPMGLRRFWIVQRALRRVQLVYGCAPSVSLLVPRSPGPAWGV